MATKNMRERVREALIKILGSDSSDNNKSYEDLRKEKTLGNADKLVGLMDSCNVSMVLPLNEASYNLMRTINDNDESWSALSPLDYHNNTGESKGKYGYEYLALFMGLAKSLTTKSKDEGVILSLKNDFPLTMTVNGEEDGKEYSFALILAPRVDNDDD